MKQLLLVAIKCKANPNSGFSLLEALIGILVITTFTLVALQALVIAATFRVKAEQKSGATNWIQERVEEAKFEAFQLDEGPSGDDPDTGLCDASSASDGYGNALQGQLSSGTGGSVTIDSENWTTINNNEDAGRGKIPGKTIWLLRNATAKDEEPYQVLELEYRAVFDDGSGNPSTDDSDIVSELYTEVIPDEAFACN